MPPLLLLALLALGQSDPGTEDETWKFLWREVLEQKNDRLRQDAVDRLARCGPRVAGVVARYLQGQGAQIPELIEKLDADDISTREAASLRLLEAGQSALKPLQQALQSGSAEVRARARELIDRITAQEAGGPRRQLTVDALVILSRSGDRDHLKLITPFFTSRDPMVRDMALSAVARLATSEDLGIFEELLRSEDEAVRTRAVRILGEVGGIPARERLFQALREDPSILVRRAASDVCYQLRIDLPGEILTAWVASAKGLTGPAQVQAFQALLRRPRKDPEVVELLWKAIEDTDPSTRQPLLAGLGAPEAALVARFTGDADPELARMARVKLSAWLKSPNGCDPQVLAHLALEHPGALRSTLRQLLLEENPGAWGILEAAEKGDVEWVVAAAAHYKGPGPSELQAPLARIRDGLPAGRERTLVESALLRCKGEEPRSSATQEVAAVPDSRQIQVQVTKLMETLRSGEKSAQSRAFAELRQLPLVRVPEGYSELPAVQSGSREALEVLRMIGVRREVPAKLSSLATRNLPNGLQALSAAGYSQLRYDIVPGDPPQGDDAFSAEGALRVSEQTVAAIVVGSDWMIAVPILRNRVRRTTPASLQALVAPAEPERYRVATACMAAGLVDLLPTVYELLEKEPDPIRQGGFFEHLTKSDPAKAAETIGRWSKQPMEDRRKKWILDIARVLPNREAVLLQLLQCPDTAVALAAADALGSAPTPEALEGFRRLWSEGRVGDLQVLGILFRSARFPEDLPLLRVLAKSAPSPASTTAARNLIAIGGAAEVDSALPAMKHDPGPVGALLAPHVTAKNRAALEALLASSAGAGSRPLRLLLAKAGRMDTLGDGLDVAPQGTDQARMVAAVVGTLQEEALLRKALALAQSWGDRSTYDEIWTALLRSPLPLSSEELGRVAPRATSPGLRSALAVRLASESSVQKEALRGLLRDSSGKEAEEILSLFEEKGSMEVAEEVLDALIPLVKKRLSPALLAGVLSTPAERDRLAPRLLKLHEDATRGMVFLDPVVVVLGAARGSRDGELLTLLHTYVSSSTLKGRKLDLWPRLIAAESLARTEPESPEVDALIRRLLRSAHPEDQSVAAHYGAWRGKRLSEVTWGLLPAQECSLFLAVESRVPTAARDAWEGLRKALEAGNLSDAAHFRAGLVLLTGRDFDIPLSSGDKDSLLRRETGLRKAREWILTRGNRPFEVLLAEALVEAGYPVKATLDANDAGELVRALRDPRWHVARNALWALGRITKEGPRSGWESALGSDSSFHLRENPPGRREIEAWEKWGADHDRRR